MSDLPVLPPTPFDKIPLTEGIVRLSSFQVILVYDEDEKKQKTFVYGLDTNGLLWVRSPYDGMWHQSNMSKAPIA